MFSLVLHHSQPQRQQRQQKVILSALIYGPDGTRINTDDQDENPPTNLGSSLDDDDSSSSCLSSPSVQQALQAAVQQHVPPHVLVTLVQAYCPPPHNAALIVSPKAILEVPMVQRVTATHLDLVISVATSNRDAPQPEPQSQQQMAQVVVPLTLPEPLAVEDHNNDDHSNTTTTVFDVAWNGLWNNLQQLERQAQDVLQTRARRQQQAVLGQQLLLESTSRSADELLPDWWIPATATNVEVQEECQTLLRLLNDDEFLTERCRWVQQSLSSPNTTTSVAMAMVVAVGPAGLVVRGALLDDNNNETNNDTNDTYDKDTNTDDIIPPVTTTVSVPLALPAIATTARELRRAVLRLLEEQEQDEDSTMKTPQVSQQEPESELVSEKETFEEKDREGDAVARMTEPSRVVESSTEAVPVVVDDNDDKKEPIVESTTPDLPVQPDKDEEEDDSVPTRDELVEERRRQPKSPEEEARLAAKYAAIPNLGERAYTILQDLGMI